MSVDENIKTVENLLTNLGYEIPNAHKPGQADDELYQVLETAFTDIKDLSISAAEKSKYVDAITADTFDDGERQIELLIMRLQSVITTDPSQAQEFLQENGAPKRFIDNAAGVADFIHNYSAYKQAILDVEDYEDNLNRLANPSANTPEDNNFSPFVGSPITAAETSAQSTIDTQNIANLQSLLLGPSQIFATQVPELSVIEVNGTWDSATKDTYLNVLGDLLGGRDKIPTNSNELESLLAQTKEHNQQKQAEAEQALERTRPELAEMSAKLTELADEEDWEIFDGGWFDFDNKTNAQLEQESVALTKSRNEKLQYQEQLTQDVENYGNIVASISNLQAASHDLAPLLAETHKSLIPPETIDANQNAKTTNQDANATNPDPQALFIETFLNDDDLHNQINTAARQISPNFTLIRPKNADDGVFDAQSQASLQQVLGILASPYALNLQQFQNDTGAIEYSPHLGREILRNLDKANTGLGAQIKQQLNSSIGEVVDPRDNNNKVEGAEALIVYLDDMHQRDMLKKQVVTKVDIPQMDPMTLSLLSGVIGWVQGSFPGLLPMIDGFIRQFTGGAGILDFLPGLAKDNPDLQQALGGMDSLSPNEQLIESFKRSFADADDATARSAMENALMRSASMLTDLPFGDAERRQNYPSAVKDALAKSLANMGNIKPSDDEFDEKLEEAAMLYADTFMENMHTLNSTHGGPVYQSNPGLRAPEFLITQLESEGLDLGQDGAVTTTEIDRVISAYNNINHGAMDYAHKPLIFTDENGQTFIAGIDQDSQMFLVRELPIDQISAAMEEGRSIDAIKDTFPGYALADINYDSYFNQAAKAGIALDQTIIYMASDPSVARPFEMIENNAKSHADEQKIIAGLEASFLDDNERDRLQHSLSRSIIHSRAQASYEGKHTSYAGQFNAASNNRNTPKIDPKTQELIDLREMMNSDAQAAAALNDAPRFYADHKGTIYGFSRINPDHGSVNHENAFETDLSMEMGRFMGLSTQERLAYQQRPELMESHFQKLTAIASQYPDISNAFAAGNSIAQQFDLRYQGVPAFQQMPQWLQDEIPTPEAQDLLTKVVASSPKIIIQGDTLRLIGKGNDEKLFIGHDIQNEVTKYGQFTDQQRDAILSNQQQMDVYFPGISNVAAQYPNIQTQTLLNAILRDPNIQETFNTPSPDAELNELTTAAMAQ